MNLYAYAVLFVFVAAAVLVGYLSRTDIPKINGLPELPGIPIFGSLFLLGKHHARNCAKLAREHGWPVFQARLGDRVCYARRLDLRILIRASESSMPTLLTVSKICG